MPKDLNILVLNSEALKLSIDDLVNEIDVPVKWDIVDLSDKEKIRKILPDYNVLVSTSLDVSMKNESKKILSLPELKVSCTCVRVPVLRSHSISINAEFESSVNIPDARESIESFTGTQLMDNPSENVYPTPIQLTENESCAVGRLRIDQALGNGLSFWVVGDQLWKGAAQNAIQIAESMIAKKSFAFTF